MPTIAVIGASSDRAKYGNRCVRAYLQAGWTVYPINPRETTIEGLTTYRSIRDIPAGPVELVSLYLPRTLGLALLDEVAERGQIRELMLNPGADDLEVVARAKELGLNAVIGCSLIALHGSLNS